MKKTTRDYLVDGRFFLHLPQLIGKFFSSIRKFVDGSLGVVSRAIIAYRTPVTQNKIIFMTYNNAYMCNPKYICEKLVEMNDDNKYELVWVISEKEKLTHNGVPQGVKCVHRNSYEHFKEMASSKIWIDNALNFVWRNFPKKKDQIYINTWHGSLGFKRIGRDEVSDKNWIKKSYKAEQYVDYLISNSEFEDKVYRTSLFRKNTILNYGHPRNDIFFKNENELMRIKQRVYDYYYIPFDVHAVLYAPTFRDEASADIYRLNAKLLRQALQERFGGEWLVLTRYHFKMKGMHAEGEGVIDVGSYPDIQELLIAADVGITDYSSWILDYALTKKPGFIYTRDESLYVSERGFYYPLKESPFPIAVNEKELSENILNFDQDSYKDAVESFLAAKGCVEDGNASIRTVEKINEILYASSSAKA